ncbi:N,N-dimethylformamidase beta subunit family domain-containing protein [Vitiosangium sp. GDMCC 1.1324]|uniref:N,N-dimethylformamidase beta subunit family domain-containing protein n=1 Tax=Vitiosangium sp. (strain GDMCC 1.1324) TaxID=2138576 RepID=UPI000D3417D5|nr:N,N-dimethylformamidase beta subunit family domain-containing protein [Vitiosangium sp. GDMCC 1.1324]PTL80328.1 hypothetical protein DAT35_30560 [Vitiosangium sp. GDMCC 1.1324]
MANELNRRDVLRGLGGLALTSALGYGTEGKGQTATSASIAAVANRTVAIPGAVEAYAQKSVAAGGTIDFRIHSTVPYQLSIVRLGWDTETPSRDWVVQSLTDQLAEPRTMTIRPGSYIHVENALAPTASLSQLTLEAWVRPFRHAWQGVISQYSYPDTCGYGLFISGDGYPYYYFGNGGAHNGSWLRAGPDALDVQQWHHLVAVFDAGTVRLYVNGVEVDSASGFPATLSPGVAPLRLGAYGDSSGTANFLDGDLAMPVIYSRALSAQEVSARANAGRSAPPTIPMGGQMLGCWPLDEETGVSVRDASGYVRPGLIVNRGTWMIGGPSFNAEAVPRFGPYNPDTDPTRGHALRLSSSDLYDCAWPISHSYTIPSECPPGIYVGRISDEAGTRLYDVTFVVRRATNRAPAPVLVLCATNTWHAYNQPLGLFSFYAAHAAGQPTYSQGIDMPWTSADPYQRWSAPEYDYSHLVRAERFTHVWLEQNGIDYDVISDQDLHLNPSVLGQYRTLFILGHSEYWSVGAYQAVADYLASGGKVIMASGNTMFWRVSYDGSVIECRKYPTEVGGFGNAKWGELYHEHDHQRGGLMREAGHPGWKVLGLECVGYDGPHVPYAVTNPTHTYFQSPEQLPVSAGTQLGGAIAVGHEWDVRLQQIPGSNTPAIPSDYTPVVLAEGRGSQGRFDYECNWVGSSNNVISEIIDWQKPNGGRVFSAGSIAVGQALHADDTLAALFRNVLHHQGVVFRLNAMAIGQDGHFYNKSFDGQNWLPSSTTWEDTGSGFGNHPPTGVQWGPNRLAAMAITATGSFFYRSFTGAAWSSWSNFGSSFQGRPAAVGWGRDRLDLFARGTDNHLYRKAWDGSAWTGWVDLGGSVASDPSAIVWEGIRLSVAVRGTAGNILYRWFDGAWNPTGWMDMGGSFAHAPTLVTWGGKYINVFAVGTDGHLYSKHWNGSEWLPSATGWQDLGGALAGPVHVAVWGRDKFTLFALGQDGRMKSKWWDGASWGPSLTDWLDLGGPFTGEPAVVSYRGHSISVMAVDLNGRLQHKQWDGYQWSGWQDMGGNLRGSPAIFRWVASS